MLKLNYDKEHLLEVIDQVVKKTMAMDMTWDWPCGVAYYGVARAYEVTGKQEYKDALIQWVDEYIELGLPDWTVNTCAMGHVLITLYETTEDQKYWDIVMSKVDYIRNKALRFADHVLQHTVSVNNDFPEQCWADTLFMAAYFLLRVGVKLNDKEIIDDALNQYYWHINYLQDSKTSLWYHGYNNINKDHMSGFYWGRANAWAAYTMSRVGKTLPEAYLYPQFMDIDCALRDQLAAVKVLQDEDGLWHTILDDPESYGEVSATAGIAAAMVTSGNPLHSKYAQKALDAVLANISEDGKVLNVSGGTAVMNDREGYRNIPNRWIQGWGQGLALALFSAVLRTK
ncbi:MAG: glycoside hydrolase family 105 protein [Lachnospiraceae bacterium]